MKYQFTVHDSQSVYNGFFKVDRHTISFEKFDGGMIENVWRECSKKGDIVAVLPYDPIRQELLMVEQFRIGMVVRGLHPWTLEIVAGFMDVVGEDAVSAAKRELKEETGCTAKTLHALLDYYPSLGGSASEMHVFIAEIDVSEALQYTGIEAEGEDICVHRFSLAEMRDKLANNEINNATAIIALQQFFMGNWAEKLSVNNGGSTS